MANLSLRGVDALTLDRIKASAKRRKLSVNRLIVDTLRQQFGGDSPAHDDLDRLAGSWTRAQAAEFEAAVAPFGTIDAELWVAEPGSQYVVRRASKRRATAVKRTKSTS